MVVLSLEAYTSKGELLKRHDFESWTLRVHDERGLVFRPRSGSACASIVFAFRVFKWPEIGLLCDPFHYLPLSRLHVHVLYRNSSMLFRALTSTKSTEAAVETIFTFHCMDCMYMCYTAAAVAVCYSEL